MQARIETHVGGDCAPTNTGSIHPAGLEFQVTPRPPVPPGSYFLQTHHPSMGDEFSLRVRLTSRGHDDIHEVCVPTDGHEDALQLHDILQLHLETRREDRQCEDTEWLHMVMVQKGLLCPCLTDSFGDSEGIFLAVLKNGNDYSPDTSAEVVDSSWYPSTSASDEASICCVCMSGVDSQAAVMTNCCGQRFHKKCIHTWLKTVHRCPLCNSESVST